MGANPEVYVESKLQALLRLLVLFIPLILIFAYEGNYLLSLYISILYALLYVFLYFFPSSVVTLFDDHIEYQKGSTRWSCPWNEVTGFYSTNLVLGTGSGGYTIETTVGNTHMISRALLTLKSDIISLDAEGRFVKSVERLSGKELVGSDPGVKKYGNKLVYIFLIVVVSFLIGIYYFLKHPSF